MKYLLLVFMLSCQNNEIRQQREFNIQKKEKVSMSDINLNYLDTKSPFEIIAEVAKLKAIKKIKEKDIIKLDKIYSIDCYLDYCSLERKSE